jgi:hypothetical protein
MESAVLSGLAFAAVALVVALAVSVVFQVLVWWDPGLSVPKSCRLLTKNLALSTTTSFWPLFFPPMLVGAPVGRRRAYIQGFLADNKEGTVILYHSKRQISTLRAGTPQKVQV